MSQRIRISEKRRDEIDVDKLVFALLRVVEQLDASQPTVSPPQRDSEGGGEKPRREEPAA